MSIRRAMWLATVASALVGSMLVGASGVSSVARRPQDSLTEHERRFAEMLKDSVWRGHWYRRTADGLEYGGEDGYRILEARRVAPGHWVIVAEFKLQGREVRFSIPARVEFVADTPVLYMDGLRLPGEPPFTVRVVFRDNMYSGLFFSEPLSGIVLGAKVTEDDPDEP